MGNHEWDDENIEQLLSNAPKIRDERSKDEILSRLKNDPRLAVPKKKNKIWKKWVPASISAAAIVTMTILISSFYNGSNSGLQEFSTNDASEDSSEQVGILNKETTQPEMVDEDKAEKYDSFANEIKLSGQPHFAVYPTDLEEGYTAFHLGMSSQTETIPVTFLINNEKIVEDFGKENPSALELYRKYADKINENAYGFNEYHPMAGSFKEEGDLIIHLLPEEHSFDIGSASEAEYFNIIQSTFYGYHQVNVVNRDGSPGEFAHTGLLDPINLKNGHFAKSYYLYTLQNGQPVLAPWFWEEHVDMESALNAMKESKSDFYQSVIPDNINFTVTEELGLVRVKFTEPLDLLSMSPDEAGRMIEGMLLTGASFQTAIKFENIVQEEWNDFKFSEPMPIPIGPNPFYLNS